MHETQITQTIIIILDVTCFSARVRFYVTNLNNTIQQSNVLSIAGSCQERCYPVSDLLCHALRTHAIVLQEQLDTTYKPGAKDRDNSWRNRCYNPPFFPGIHKCLEAYIPLTENF